MGKSTRIVFVGIVLIGAIGLGIKVATSNSSPRKMEDLPWGQIEFVSGNRLQTTGKTAEI